MRRVELLEAQLKREIEKSNRQRMTVNNLEVFFDGLASEIKSVRLEILTPENLVESIARFAEKASPAIQRFCRELREFLLRIL